MSPGTGSTLNYAFDASGSLTTLPTGASGNYDRADELTSSTLSTTTTTYAYNPDGERLTAKQGSATLASGSWNGSGELAAYSNSAANMSTATYDGNGLRATMGITPAGGSASTQNFVWNTSPGMPSLLADSVNAYIYSATATPIEQVNLNTGVITYLMDDAWGNPPTAIGLTAYSPFGFAGAYTDATGLIYLINRYYDPASGQFFQWTQI
jgi:YD repeat-containing protein